jgi:hypothetical protein
MAQKSMLLAEVHVRALRANQNVKGAEVWVGARCALRVGWARNIFYGHPESSPNKNIKFQERTAIAIYSARARC